MNHVVFHFQMVEAVYPKTLVSHSIQNSACAHRISELLQSKWKNHWISMFALNRNNTNTHYGQYALTEF